MAPVKAKKKTRSPATTSHEKFPPLSISSKSFISNGSDAEFRRLIYHVLSTSAMMLKARERFAAYIGVTAPQYSMMVSIGEAGSATIGQIAQAIHVSSPFVTAEIGKLIKRGIVNRQPNEADARSSLLTLTEHGMDLIRQVGPYRRTANDIIFGFLSPGEAKQFSRTMEQLYINCERALHELDAPHWRMDAKPAEPAPLRKTTRRAPRRAKSGSSAP
jgi:DNA-binding MarR family transcriptional regulator